MVEQITLSARQVLVVARALKEYEGLLETRLRDLEEEAKEGIPGAPSEYARTQDELDKVKHLLSRVRE